ncbi:MAG TPA: single-stranded DNA-binding protein [Chitinophagaceae bacterium]|nr:single-stranded DNA-binding protein [Chitinophagaceae bacterium]MCC6635207.1 single-stranded DNA-binding protein [Chitinophagaceae bacterium]HMZ46411.1 single-stranded DNA-binding protein [Chitinophagaceae bacterium]HNF30177.1 single-stranded DNA-binding protein [Chitinophagaceae bacterium]HNJ59224.1 single-stranded DNA-binding protein [Chitinophagaceae bacterium]
MIKLQVIGNLGKDATVNNVNGKNVINFNMAHTERYKDAQGNQKDRTIWVECAYWTDKTAIQPYLKKGTQVYVEGNPDVRTYQTQDGKNGASLTLRIQNIQLLGTRSSDNTSAVQNNTPPQQNTNFTPTSDMNSVADDLPF